MAEIKLSRAERVLRIHLNRPRKRSAMTAEMYQAITDAMADAADDPEIGCLLVTAVGDLFTAGNDIGDLLSRPPDGDGSGVERFLEGLVSQPKPLVAAVQGAAAGVGTTMLLHCDLVVAADTAVFSSSFTSLSLAPEATSTYLMPLMVGYRSAAALLMAVERLLEKERTLGPDINFQDVVAEVGGVYPRIMRDSDMDAGAWSCGMVAWLIRDVPTVQVLIDRIMAEAEGLIAGGLARLAA